MSSEQKRADDEDPGAVWPRVYGYALALAGEPGWAEDLCQEGYLRLLRKGGARPGAVVPYLLAIVRNLHRSEWRRRGRGREGAVGVGDEAEGTAEDPGEVVARREAAERLWERLGALPSLWREVLYLREGLELSYRQIAEITGRGEDVVRTTLYRARRRARCLAAERPEGREP